MTLRSALQNIPDHTIIYIGCVDGSNFLFIGSAGYFKSHEADINKEATRDIDYTIKKQTDQMNYYRLHGRMDERKYKSAVEQQKILEQRKKEWVNHADREVVEQYPRYSKNPGRVFLLEGPDKGSYWFLDEYQADHPMH